MSGGRYVTAAELVRLDEQLSRRERQIVRLLSVLSLMSGNQLRRVCFADEKKGRSDPQVARRVLLRLTRRGVLVRLTRRVGGVKRGSDGFTYRLGPVGQRLACLWAGQGLSRGRSPVEPGERFAAHRLALSELYVRLHEAAERGQLALLEFAAEPACWRAFNAPFRGAVTLKPDAFARIAVGADEEFELWWFIEIDRGTVSQATRARQAAAYRTYWRSGAHEVMPRVLWVTKDADTSERATAAVEPDLEPKGLFVVTADAQALDAVVTAEVRS